MEVSIIYAYPNNNSYNLSILETEKKNLSPSTRHQNLWLCTHSKGLEKITFLGSQFHIYPRMGHSYDLNANTVRALFEDSEHRIWMGKRDGQIEIYSSDLDFQGILTEEGIIAKSGRPLSGVPYHIMQDSRGNIWIATKGDGIILAEKEGAHFKFYCGGSRRFSIPPRAAFFICCIVMT